MAVGASTCASGSHVWEGKDWHLNGKSDKEAEEYPNLEVEVVKGVSLCSR